MQEGGSYSLRSSRLFASFLCRDGVLVGKVLGVKVFVNASPLLGRWVHPARSEQSFELLALILQEIALNTAKLPDRFLQALLPVFFLRSFFQQKTLRESI